MTKATKIVNYIKDQCVHFFDCNLSSIIQIGSSLNGEIVPNDIDMIIILKERESVRDLLFLKNIVEEINFPMDVQVINMVDTKSWNFSHHSHGQFFLYFLKEGKAIYGTNPFSKMQVSNEMLLMSVCQKAQYYYCRIKKQVLEYQNHDKPMSIQELKYHRKKIRLMLLDYWLAVTGGVDGFQRKPYKHIMSDLGLGKLYLQNSLLENEDRVFSQIQVLSVYQDVYFAISSKLNAQYEKILTT